MRWLVRVALLFLAVWLALRWVARALGGRPAAPARGGTMKRDPVCGTYVAPEVSFPETRGGQTLYFCSEHCRQEYRAGQRGVEAGSG